MSTDAPALHLTIDEVAKWRRTLANNAAQIERLVAENKILEDRLDAVRTLAPNLFEGGAVGEAGQVLDADKLETWVDLVFYALTRATGGRNQSYMLEVGRKTSLADRVVNNPNGLYNAVARMTGRGDIIRRGDLFYLPERWAAIEAGEIEDDAEDQQGYRGAIADAFAEVMADGEARQPRDIFDAVQDPGVRAKLRANPNYGYTVLGRMVERGALTRREGLYTLAQESNEAPNGRPAGTSEAGEAPTSPNETGPLFRVVQ